jgi:hypothetical protein
MQEEALAPKPPVPKAAALEDFDIPLAEEGRAIPVVFGEVVLNSPSVMWYGALRTSAIKKKGGKKKRKKAKKAEGESSEEKGG